MGKLAFIFSGQGSQYVGMGQEIVENFDIAKTVFNKSSEIVGFDVKSLCAEGPIEKLSDTKYTQPAMVTTSIAIYEVLKAKNILPDVVAGFSLGEYSALYASGIFNLESTIDIVNKRGKIMDTNVPSGIGGMSAIVGLDREIIENICERINVTSGVCEVANYNCPNQIVIGGELKALEQAEALLKETGAKRVIRLNVSGPFHTSLLETASQELNKELQKININEKTCDIVMNVTGKYLQNESIVDLMTKQVKSSVYFEDSIKNMIADGVDTFIEIGPGKVLSGLVRKTDRKVTILNVEDMASLEKVIEHIKGEKEA